MEGIYREKYDQQCHRNGGAYQLLVAQGGLLLRYLPLFLLSLIDHSQLGSVFFLRLAVDGVQQVDKSFRRF